MGFFDREFKLIGHSSPQKENLVIFRIMVVLILVTIFYILSFYIG